MNKLFKRIYDDYGLSLYWLRPILYTLAFVILFSIVSNMFTFTVNEGEYAAVKKFSKIQYTTDESGLHFKSPLQSVNKISKKFNLLDIDPSNVLTADKKAFIVDTYSVWKITDVTKFLQTAVTVSNMESRINPAVYNSTKTLLGTHEQSSLIGLESNQVRNIINETITKNSDDALNMYGIDTLSVAIKGLDLPATNEESVYKRMISEREQIAKTFIADGVLEASKIKNEADKEKSIILGDANATKNKLYGEGESEYMKILADAYSSPERAEFYKFFRSLEALEKTLSGDNDKTIILSKDSPIVQALIGK